MMMTLPEYQANKIQDYVKGIVMPLIHIQRTLDAPWNEDYISH